MTTHKRPSLLDTFSTQPEPAPAPAEVVPLAAPRKRAAKSAAEEIVQTSFRLPRSRWKKLHELALDGRESVQSIIVDALEQEFSRRGLRW